MNQYFAWLRGDWRNLFLTPHGYFCYASPKNVNSKNGMYILYINVRVHLLNVTFDYKYVNYVYGHKNSFIFIIYYFYLQSDQTINTKYHLWLYPINLKLHSINAVFTNCLWINFVNFLFTNILIYKLLIIHSSNLKIAANIRHSYIYINV